MTPVAIERPQPARLPVLICLVLGLLGTLPLVVLTPPFAVPDEPLHFDRAYQVSEGRFLAEVKDGVAGGMVPASLVALRRRFLHFPAPGKVPDLVPHPLAETLAARAIPLAPARRAFVGFTGAAAYPPLAYLPQAAGIAIGRVFGAGPLVLLWLARLLNALTAVGLLSLAIGLMPFARLLALLCGLLPMAVFQYASASADGVVISGAFLVTALELRALARGRWRGWEVAATALLGLFVCSTKPVYAPLLLIALPAALVPGQRRNQLLALAAILLVAIGGAGAWFWDNAGRLIAVNAQASLHAQAGFVAAHPFGFLAAMAASLEKWFNSYLVAMIGLLGWWAISLPPFAYPLAGIGFALGWLVAGRERVRIHPGVFAWWVLMFAGAATLIMLAMYLDYSPVGGTLIIGVQGRYFVPLLLLVAAMACAAPAPAIGRRGHAWLVAGVSAIAVLNVASVILAVALGFHVLG